MEKYEINYYVDLLSRSKLCVDIVRDRLVAGREGVNYDSLDNLSEELEEGIVKIKALQG